MAIRLDDHRRDGLPYTKCLKFLIKPFQRLAECEAEPHEEKLGGERGGSPENHHQASVFLSAGFPVKILLRRD